ncbi:MAG: M1 family metallopeptidase [Bdellovibrionia bacterium]
MNYSAQAMKQLMLIASVLLILLFTKNSFGQVIHQDLKLQLSPSLKMVQVEVTLTFPSQAPRKTTFLLNKNLKLLSFSLDDKVNLIQSSKSDEAYNQWGVELSSTNNKLSLVYSGILFDDFTDGDSAGFVSSDGAVLMGSTYWYPFFFDTLYTFDLMASLPQGWSAINQGQQTSQMKKNNELVVVFKEMQPQEDLYLIAGKFFEYTTEDKRGLQYRVFLRQENRDLAQNYLALLPDYMAHFQKTIGGYPYRHFTVVENFWETGYGMPAFTLLGPTVVKLPFILTSSLPHELLHNWWGNSVYVDYSKGNWAEGLTTYLADHWQQEEQKLGAEYRLSQLMAYSDFVKGTDDFPLNEFKGRHNQASQAVGYGKAMMLFHMLKKAHGEAKFNEAIQKFYTDNIFKRVSYAELQKAFEDITKKDLSGFFKQWVERKGAPKIELKSANTFRWADGGYSVSFALRQSQAELYDLEIPVRWTLENGARVLQKVRLQLAEQTFTFTHTQRPVAIEVDPEFDVFRLLYAEERPVSLSQLYTSEAVTTFYTEDQQSLLALADHWKKHFSLNMDVQAVQGNFTLPKTGNILLLGSASIFEDLMKFHLKGADFYIDKDKISVQGYNYRREGNSFVLSVRSRHNPIQTITWILADEKMDKARWAQRLTHYSKFGVLVFEGDKNVLKTNFPSNSSPLKITPLSVLDVLETP